MSSWNTKLADHFKHIRVVVGKKPSRVKPSFDVELLRKTPGHMLALLAYYQPRRFYFSPGQIRYLPGTSTKRLAEVISAPT